MNNLIEEFCYGSYLFYGYAVYRKNQDPFTGTIAATSHRDAYDSILRTIGTTSSASAIAVHLRSSSLVHWF